jgi:Co/Zn/Cd efflux system component
MVWDIPFIDTIAALVSSVVIIKWSVELLKDSGKALLDINPKTRRHEHHHH